MEEAWAAEDDAEDPELLFSEPLSDPEKATAGPGTLKLLRLVSSQMSGHWKLKCEPMSL